MGVETFDQVVSVTMIDSDGTVFEKPVSEMVFHYRNVPELAHNVAVAAVFRGHRAGESEIAGKLQASKSKRKDSQPIGASAGCIFKNPDSIGAGRLVDELGLKGLRVGDARISQVHGNFIVNEGGATASDVLRLIAQIKERALEARGIEMETEVQIIGQDEGF